MAKNVSTCEPNTLIKKKK